MANNFKLSVAARNANVDAVTALLNGGFIKIYDGSQPANPDTAISTQNLLVSSPLANPAAAAASSGTATFNAITSAVIGATGTAAWFRGFKSNGTTAVCDGTVGTSGCDLNISGTVSLVSGATFSISSLTLTQS